jgi:hypothetical protein
MVLAAALAVASPTPARAQDEPTDATAEVLAPTATASTDPPVASDSAARSEPPTEAPPSGPRTSFSASLNQDIFFGFYGTAAGTVELVPSVSLSVYTILWTTPSFSVGGTGGSGLWTEFGAGVVIQALEDRLSINPQIGILSGVLLSGADRGVVFDGIVPNLTANYRDDLVQAQIYFGYYLGLREQRPNDFIHYWANIGLRPTSFLAFGAHWEHLVHSRGATGDENLYMWAGPYAELTAGSFSLRLTAGVDVADADVQVREFYKVSVGGTF